MKRIAAWIALEGGYRDLLDRDAREGRMEVDKLLRVCRRAGIELLFPCSREADNRTIYASRLERNFYRWDALRYLCARCAELGIEVHPWIISWYDRGGARPDLHVKTRDSISAKEPWFCPARPESHAYFRELIADLLERYPVQGIHLDYIRYQDKPCYCDFHRSEFKKRSGFDPLDLTEGSEGWEDWNEYNVATITSFVKEVSMLVRASGRKTTAAVFMPVDFHRDASRNPFRLDRIGRWDGHCEGCPHRDTIRCKDCSRDYAIFQRWSDWCREGYLDLVCPMNYTADADVHRQMLEREVAMAAKVPLVSGLSLFPENTAEGTAEQIRQAAAAGVGVCFFDLIRLSQKSESDLELLRSVLR